MIEWIPVKKRLPKSRAACLVTIILDGEPFVRPAYYVGDIVEGGWLLEHGHNGKNITAWMPHPEPYIEDGLTAS